MHSIERTTLNQIGGTNTARAQFVAHMIRAQRNIIRAADTGVRVQIRNMTVRLAIRAKLREDYGIVWRPR